MRSYRVLLTCPAVAITPANINRPNQRTLMPFWPSCTFHESVDMMLYSPMATKRTPQISAKTAWHLKCASQITFAQKTNRRLRFVETSTYESICRLVCRSTAAPACTAPMTEWKKSVAKVPRMPAPSTNLMKRRVLSSDEEVSARNA